MSISLTRSECQDMLEQMKAYWIFPLAVSLAAPAGAADLRLGIIGTDTSHAVAFTTVLNDSNSPNHVAGARVVAAYKGGSPDIEESTSRVDKYAAELKDKWSVRFVNSIPEL